MVRPLKPRSWFWMPPPKATDTVNHPKPKYLHGAITLDRPSAAAQKARRRRITLPKTSIQRGRREGDR
jgi:hypothetical protein